MSFSVGSAGCGSGFIVSADVFVVEGGLCITSLKSIAPLLVFVRVAASIANHRKGARTRLKSILALYFVGTFAAAVCACGASSVAGGPLLLIPVTCSLFGISNDLAMQVVGVGFIIGVLQDSAETALNSSTDVLFTAAGSVRGATSAG